MSIFGTGIDQVEIERIHKIIENDRSFLFRNKVFSESEVEYCEKSIKKSEHYGARFAAKEAFIKAFGQTDVSLKEIVVEKTNTGKPFIKLSDSLQKRLNEIGSFRFHLSLTHTQKTASAIVIIEEQENT